MAIKSVHTTSDGSEFLRLEDAKFHESFYQSMVRLIKASTAPLGSDFGQVLHTQHGQAALAQFIVANRNAIIQAHTTASATTKKETGK